MLQIGAALFYYKLGQTLLQIGASVVTYWGSYYQLGQPLLQNKAAVTNWGKMYYKLGHNKYLVYHMYVYHLKSIHVIFFYSKFILS